MSASTVEKKPKNAKAEPASMEATGDRFIAAVAVGDAASVKTPRTLVAKFPTKDLIILPEENYRWGSQAAMDLDLGRDGGHSEQRRTYETTRESIRAVGVEDPIGAVRRDDGIHVIFGFTRAVAALEVGAETVPVFVYDAGMSDDEVDMLQAMENSLGVKRAVNWVNEFEMFDNLVVRFMNRGFSKKDAGAKVAVFLGCDAHTMDSRRCYLKNLDIRVRELARQGRVSCPVALEFRSGDADAPFSEEYIGAILKELRIKEGALAGQFPATICIEQVRRVKKRVGLTRKAYEDDALPRKTPNKNRQSPSILRDVSVLMAQRMLSHNRISQQSEVMVVEALTRSYEWAQIVGLGMGAGEVSMPPVLENELSLNMRRDKSAAFLTNAEDLADDNIQEAMQAQHDETSTRYATGIFIQAFLRNALDRQGVKNFDRDQQGWICRSSVIGDTTKNHRSVFYGAVQRAVGMPGAVTLKDRVLAAWQDVRVLVAPGVKLVKPSNAA